MITLGEESLPGRAKNNCAPGLSSCAKKIIGGKCPGGNICISGRRFDGVSVPRAIQFHADHGAARTYLEERQKRRQAAGEEKMLAYNNARLASTSAASVSTDQ